jgi:hypothetical protein
MVSFPLGHPQGIETGIGWAWPKRLKFSPPRLIRLHQRNRLRHSRPTSTPVSNHGRQPFAAQHPDGVFYHLISETVSVLLGDTRRITGWFTYPVMVYLLWVFGFTIGFEREYSIPRGKAPSLSVCVGAMEVGNGGQVEGLALLTTTLSRERVSKRFFQKAPWLRWLERQWASKTRKTSATLVPGNHGHDDDSIMDLAMVGAVADKDRRGS